MKKTVRKTVPETFDGIKAGIFIKIEMEASSTLIKRLKKSEDGIKINGKRAYTNEILHTGDEVEINFEDEAPSENIIPTKGDIDIIYEDGDLLIVNKAAGVPVHPSKGHVSDSLANFVAYYFNKKGEIPVFRCVTRLDRGTSGVCVIAKNSRAQDILRKEMQNGQIGKKYLAAAVGIFDKKSGIIDRNIRRIPGIATIKREVCDGDGKRAVTEYKILKEQNGLSLAEIILHTGRTHQIRVHFAAEGLPLFGDWLYGKETAEIGRPALHCAEITFLHPDTKEKLCFTAPLPDDIKSLFS